MKSTFLVYVDPQNPKAGLRTATIGEWDRILKENRHREKSKRRYFICDSFEDCGEIDRMFIETSKGEYDKWHSQYVETTRKKKLKSDYRAVSLDQKIPGTNCSYGDTAADSFDLEEVVISGLRMKMLLEELKQWNPWAVDLFELYSCGMKTEATFILSRRYSTTIRTVQRWKEQFEKYVKVFFEEN